jgi:hypothetical protein
LAHETGPVMLAPTSVRHSTSPLSSSRATRSAVVLALFDAT